MSNYKWREVGFVGTALETVVALHNSQVDELQAEIVRLRDELAAANARAERAERYAAVADAEIEAWRAWGPGTSDVFTGMDRKPWMVVTDARAATDAARKERGQ